MKIKVERDVLASEYTHGRMTIDDRMFCYTLEDTDRYLENGGEKIYGKTAIPRGIYKVIITFSNHFQKPLPLLLDVPGYEGVRIHAGNTVADTEGCILLGTSRGHDTVGNSRMAVQSFMDRMESALERGEGVTLEVV